MASKQEEQEAPTTLRPCHIIRLAYPAYNYDDDAFPLPQGSRVVETILNAPANVSERHEPVGLVEYRQGDDRTLYDATDQASFAYVTNTDQLAARHCFIDDTLASAAAFVKDVKDASAFVGSTAILIDTVVVQDQQGKRTKTLLIERSTVFERPRSAAFPQGALTAIRSSKLVLPVVANVLPSALCSEQWYADIGNLINRTTDHAVRHVHLSISRKGVREQGTYSWKLRRCSTLEKLIDKRYAPVAISELRFMHDRCTICHGGFDEKDHSPMRRRNTDFSTTGRNCLIDEFQRTSSCDDDGVLDQDPALMLAELKRGTVTVEMPHDASYSVWEMLERGYADLDREPVRGDPDVVTMDGAFLIAAWNWIVGHAKEEEISSTPQHLRVLETPEFAVVEEAIVDALERTRLTLQISQWYDYLMKVAVRGLNRQSSSLEQFRNQNDDVNLMVFKGRPGLKALVSHVLQRTLRTWQLRECKKCKVTEKIWHCHGMRHYYNREAFDRWMKEVKARVQSAGDDDDDSDATLKC